MFTAEPGLHDYFSFLIQTFLPLELIIATFSCWLSVWGHWLSSSQTFQQNYKVPLNIIFPRAKSSR